MNCMYHGFVLIEDPKEEKRKIKNIMAENKRLKKAGEAMYEACMYTKGLHSKTKSPVFSKMTKVTDGWDKALGR